MLLGPDGFQPRSADPPILSSLGHVGPISTGARQRGGDRCYLATPVSISFSFRGFGDCRSLVRNAGQEQLQAPHFLRFLLQGRSLLSDTDMLSEASLRVEAVDRRANRREPYASSLPCFLFLLTFIHGKFKTCATVERIVKQNPMVLIIQVTSLMTSLVITSVVRDG